MFSERLPEHYRQVNGAKKISATYSKTIDCASLKWWRRRDSNPNLNHSKTDTSATKGGQNCAKAIHDNTLANPSRLDQEQKLHDSKHQPDISVHFEGVPGEYQIPDDLAEVVAAWPELSEEVRAEILAKVKRAT